MKFFVFRDDFLRFRFSLSLSLGSSFLHDGLSKGSTGIEDNGQIRTNLDILILRLGRLIEQDRFDILTGIRTSESSRDESSRSSSAYLIGRGGINVRGEGVGHSTDEIFQLRFDGIFFVLDLLRSRFGWCL